LMGSTVDDDDQLVVYFKKPIPPCRVPVERPDGRVVLVRVLSELLDHDPATPIMSLVQNNSSSSSKSPQLLADLSCVPVGLPKRRCSA